MKTILPLMLVSALCVHAAPSYQLHEWGTFTTVSGSDGVLLAGLQREEESLPMFAYSHIGFENGQTPDPAVMVRLRREHGLLKFAPGTKGLGNRPVKGVTVKMETPVLYFHSPESFRASVKVGFNGGSISQWYPQRSGGEKMPEPAPSADPINKPTPLSEWTIDFSKSWKGGIEWNINVLSPEESRKAIVFKPGDTVGWLRARVPEANVVRTDGGETEGYLFYRGVGNFDPGLKTTVDEKDTLHLSNQAGGKIPFLLVFEQREGKARWFVSSQGLEATKELEVPVTTFRAWKTGFDRDLYQTMREGLAACGLTDAEAQAMVQTWWPSYFEAEGLRVFWVLPQQKTEEILPLKVAPAPKELVRVLVGRSEVLRPAEERDWLAWSALSPEKDARWSSVVSAHRFGLAIEERIKGLKMQAQR